MDSSLQIDPIVNFYVEFPKVFHKTTEKLFCSGYVESNINFIDAALFLNDEKVSPIDLFPHYCKENGEVRKNAFIINYELKNVFDVDEIKFSLIFSTESSTYRHTIDPVSLKKETRRINAASKNTIAVCMPIYNPNIELFERQLNSILNQTYKDVQIIIQDDDSDIEIKSAVKKILSNYPRVILIENESNLGFYNNIESLLYKLSDTFEYICLSDQDDYWQEDKIAQQVAVLQKKEVDLVYSDLKIINREGETLSESFWNNRSNHFSNLEATILNNVATGSTMCIKREWLVEILPFPQQIGKSYHDHWICAKSRKHGKTHYIDAPLVNYVQHGNNITGFQQFRNNSIRKRLINFMSLVIVSSKVVFKRDISDLEEVLSSNHKIYYTNVQRINTFHSLLGIRTSDLKTIANMVSLSLQTIFKNYHFNKTEVAIYTSIVYNFAIKFRYFLKFRNEK